MFLKQLTLKNDTHLNMDYDAVIYQFDEQIAAVAYEDMDHYQISKYFLMNRERFLQQLFAEGED